MCRSLDNLRFIEDLIDNSDTLSDYRKKLLKHRYLRILREFRFRCNFYSFVFHVCRIMVSVGSILVPGLLAIQYSKQTIFTSQEMMETAMYWATWSVSLMVTIANGIFTLFKIDKKYYFLHSLYEKLQSEGYQYLECTGRYSGILNRRKRAATHDSQFIYFCHSIEKLKMMQTLEEYFKLSETSSSSSSRQEVSSPIGQNVNSIVPNNPVSSVEQEPNIHSDDILGVSPELPTINSFNLQNVRTKSQEPLVLRTTHPRIQSRVVPRRDVVVNSNQVELTSSSQEAKSSSPNIGLNDINQHRSNRSVVESDNESSGTSIRSDYEDF